jgi:hypothetical protein
MSAIAPGDRVQVKPRFDETLVLIGRRTGPGTVAGQAEPRSDTSEVLVVLDDGQAVPYPLHKLDRLTSGVDLIATERRRQVLDEGYPTAHDVAHQSIGQLAAAAWCYIGDVLREQAVDHDDEPEGWPWPDGQGGCHWRPTPTDALRQLTKAGALIAAELDRRLAVRAAETAELYLPADLASAGSPAEGSSAAALPGEPGGSGTVDLLGEVGPTGRAHPTRGDAS